jgi:hypothetical protein
MIRRYSEFAAPVMVRVFDLPHVFGYSFALRQIWVNITYAYLHQSGVVRFFTHKISSVFNRRSSLSQVGTSCSSH